MARLSDERRAFVDAVMKPNFSESVGNLIVFKFFVS